MSDPVILKTVSDALALIEKCQDEEFALTGLSFDGELARLNIVINGERYKGTVPSELARSLWDYQESLYKAVAQVLYGSEDMRKLTSEQRESFELVFRISEGSTDAEAKLSTFLERLADGLTNMSDRNKCITLVLIAVVMATGYGASTVIESQAAAKLEQIKADTQIASEQEKTRQFQVFAATLAQNDEAKRLAQAGDEGTRAIMRGAPDASSLKVGRVRFTSSEIHEVNQRAPKIKSDAKVIQEEFSIFGADTRHNSSTRYTLSRHDGTEFSVTVNHDDFQQADLDRLWAAARERKGIRLEVNLTLNRGVVRAAQIVQVL